MTIPRLIGSGRFDADAALVSEKLELVQELMLDCGTSLSLFLDRVDGGVRLSIQSKDPLAPRWLGKPKILKSICNVAFDDQIVDHLELFYDEGLGGCPRGTLTLSGKKRETTLILPGYPGRIKRGEEAPRGKDAHFPREFFKITFENLELLYGKRLGDQHSGTLASIRKKQETT